jgi:hypothetical protein
MNRLFFLVVIALAAFCLGWRFSLIHERTLAVHGNAAEYYIDANTYERKFRYKQPVMAPTPLPYLEPALPPFGQN